MALLGVACFVLAGRLVDGWRAGRLGAGAPARPRSSPRRAARARAAGGPGVRVRRVRRHAVRSISARSRPSSSRWRVAYAIVKHDLFELDAMVKRGAYYLLLTGAVGAAYAAPSWCSIWRARRVSVTGSAAFPVALHARRAHGLQPAAHRAAGVRRSRLLPHPLRRRAGARGGRRELAAALTREHIAELGRAGVERAIPNPRTRLFVRQAPDALREVGGDDTVLPAELVPPLRRAGCSTAFDARRELPDAASAPSACGTGLRALGRRGGRAALAARRPGGRADRGPEAVGAVLHRRRRRLPARARPPDGHRAAERRARTRS